MVFEAINDLDRGTVSDGRKKIKVLYIDSTIGFGGATKSLSLTLGGLQSVEKVILTSQEAKIIRKWYEGLKVYKFREVINYRNHMRVSAWLIRNVPIALLANILVKFMAFLDILVSLVNTLRIIGIVKTHKVDLIHLNTSFELEGILAARILKIPCVAHLRGFFPKQENGVYSAIKYISHMICVSRAVSDSVPLDKIDRSKITIIYDPVDVAVFERIASKRESVRSVWGLEEGDIGVGIFGRVVPWKGQLEFVYALLQTIRTENRIKAFIVGDKSDGPAEYFDRVKGIINSSEYGDHFILTGYQEDVEAYYSAMDIIVHASVEPEPFGMVITEAMAAKKPVVAADEGGPREVIDPGVDGIVITPRDIEGMAAAILELANNPVKRQAMGINGYNKVKERFNIQNIASQVECLYQKLLSRSIAQ